MDNLIEIILTLILVIIIFRIFTGYNTGTMEYMSPLKDGEGTVKEYMFEEEHMLDCDEDLDSDSDSDSDNGENISPNDNNGINAWATLEEFENPLIPESNLSNSMCGVDVSGINLDKYVQDKIQNYAFGDNVQGGDNGFYDNRFETGDIRSSRADDGYDIEESLDNDVAKKYNDQYFNFYDKINGSSSDAVDAVDKVNVYLLGNNSNGTNIQDIYDNMTSNR